MQHPPIRRLTVRSFRVLKHVELHELGPLNVLVGPNASGKSTLLQVIRFLGDAARLDLLPALDAHGGWSSLRTRDGTGGHIRIEIGATVTKHSHAGALDEYVLSFGQVGRVRRLIASADSPRRTIIRRFESFRFKRTPRQGRRITLKGGKLFIHDPGHEKKPRPGGSLAKGSLLLSTLPKLGREKGGAEMDAFANIFMDFRVFDIDVAAAIQPSAQPGQVLAPDASNLAAFLAHLRLERGDVFDRLNRDACAMIPGLTEIGLRDIGGPARGVVVELHERGLEGPTDLAAASFGTVRCLALLAMLHDPAPPQLTCVEEMDHGLHPYLFDRLVELLRRASQRTQFLVATHSPALVNRLRASELVVCERDADRGVAHIPAISSGDVAAMVDDLEEHEEALRLGELWFAGSLGGVPE